MSKPIATLATQVSGKWDLHVQESILLPRLRQQALRESRGLDTDGSAEAWLRLPSEDRVPADLVLADLVVLNQEALLGSIQQETFATGFRPNLLTDAGLDYVCANASSLDFFEKAVLGTGTTPTVYSSGAVTATASGTTASSSSGFFTAGMVGMVINWDSGENAYIASVTDDSNVVLETSVTATGAFAVHAVNRTGLASISVSQTTKTSDSTVRSGGVTTRTMSWVFALETANKNYTEGGIYTGWNGSTYATPLSIFLLSGGTVTVLIGQQAKLYYAFSASVNTEPVTGVTWPMSEYDVSDPGGWDSPTGQHQVTSVCSLDGLTPYADSVLLPTGSSSLRAVLSTTSSLFPYTDENPPSTTGAIGGYVTGSYSTYVSKTFYRDKTYYFSASHSNTSAIRSFMVHAYWDRVGWQFLFDSAKTKDGNHALSLTIRCALNRVLVNP